MSCSVLDNATSSISSTLSNRCLWQYCSIKSKNIIPVYDLCKTIIILFDIRYDLLSYIIL